MIVRILTRRDTTANWQAVNPVLGDGELGIERLSNNENKIKIGDGVTPWNSLSYSSGGEANIPAGTSGQLMTFSGTSNQINSTPVVSSIPSSGNNTSIPTVNAVRSAIPNTSTFFQKSKMTLSGTTLSIDLT